MSDEEAMALLKVVFKHYESENQLRKVIQALVSEDPKQYLQKLGNVGNFHLAKFGVLQQIGNNVHKKTP
jgi:hypothetical protein